MDLQTALDSYGIPLTLVIAFGYYIWKQNSYIQDELDQHLDDSFNRLEGIIVKLIDQQKSMQIELAKVKGYVEGIEDILCRLTGLKIKDRNDN